MSLMSKKNTDQIDQVSEEAQKKLEDAENRLSELEIAENQRLYWQGKSKVGEKNPAELSNKQMIKMLSSLSDKGLSFVEKFEFPAMEEYKKHSFPKSTRLNVVPMTKLLHIEKMTGKSFSDLVLETIENEYNKCKRSK